MYCIPALPGQLQTDCGSSRSWIAKLVPSVPISLSANPLNFTYQIGSGSAPPAQGVTLSGSSPLAFSAATTGGSWLSVALTQKASPPTFSVLVESCRLRSWNLYWFNCVNRANCEWPANDFGDAYDHHRANHRGRRADHRNQRCQLRNTDLARIDRGAFR